MLKIDHEEVLALEASVAAATAAEATAAPGRGAADKFALELAGLDDGVEEAAAAAAAGAGGVAEARRSLHGHACALQVPWSRVACPVGRLACLLAGRLTCWHSNPL